MIVTLTDLPEPTIVAKLSPDEATRLRHAQSRGTDLSALFAYAIPPLPSETPTFHNIFSQMDDPAPVDDLSDEEFEEFLQKIVHEVRADMIAKGM